MEASTEDPGLAVQRNFWLPRELAAWLNDYAHEESKKRGTRVSQAAIVRDALDRLRKETADG